MVNAAVAYLTWLTLGCPGEWTTATPHPLCVELSQEQTMMCSELLTTFTSVCRPDEQECLSGGGLANFIETVEQMTNESNYRQTDIVPGSGAGIALPLVAGKISLPLSAAGVDLTSPAVLPGRLIDYLLDEERMLKSDALLEGPCPRMHFDVEDWRALASDLWECGMTRWVDSTQIPMARGKPKRAGLFGVPKAVGDKLRLIVDRRPSNWTERSLRELLLEDLANNDVSFDEFEWLWRLMTLPHPGVLQDLFLGRQGELRVSAEDCSDYFYSLRLPSALHLHTALGFDLPKEMVAQH
eukprot:6483376-Amphidinium_carterae.1